ncbi:MAG: choice-of-anchor tandem repeat GloVer-containing protein [Candidatus Sulfotelmatobacter sp.]
MPLSIYFLLAVTSSPALGQTVSVLHSFNGGADGGYPVYETLAQGTDGNLYGTATGGASADGTVFRITPGGALTTLYDFDDTDSSSPGAGLVLSTDGLLYGTTPGGGTFGSGVVFSSGGGPQIVVRLNLDGSDGASPVAPVVLGTDGNYYGEGEIGGADNCGTVFKLTPDGAVTVLHSFSGADGLYPRAASSTGQTMPSTASRTTGAGGIWEPSSGLRRPATSRAFTASTELTVTLQQRLWFSQATETSTAPPQGAAHLRTELCSRSHRPAP